MTSWRRPAARSVGGLLRNWLIVYAGNLVGAVSVAVMVLLARWWTLDDGAVGQAALQAAAQKASLGFGVVFWRGVLANALVCLAVWIATGGRSPMDKVIAIAPPIAAFVANAFEHSVANMYFLSLGLLLKREEVAGVDAGELTTANALRNLAASTLGNIVGGALLVCAIYWFVYLRPTDRRADPGPSGDQPSG